MHEPAIPFLPTHVGCRRWITAIAACLVLVTAATADDTPATKETLAQLVDASARKRVEVAWHLKDLRTKDAETAWTAVLRDPKRRELHFEAAARLADFESVGKDATEALEAALEGEDRAVRLAAAVALGRTQPHAGPLDSMHAKEPGEPFLGPLPDRLPAEGGPTTFDAAALDTTLWVRSSGINILGEGARTYVALLRVGDDLVARTARVERRLDRNPPPDGKPRPLRGWTTQWSLTTGWLDVKAGGWLGSRGQRMSTDVGADASVGVGLVRGRLAAPALVRGADARWTYTGTYENLVMTFRGAMAVGREGTVALSIEPRSGAAISGQAVWRVDEGPDGPILHIDPTMKIEGGARRIRPNEFLLDTATGAGAELGRSPWRPVRWQFAGRLSAPPARK